MGNSRSLESRAAGACSDQSKPIDSKQDLIKKYENHLNQESPKRPVGWRAYLIKPDYFESGRATVTDCTIASSSKSPTSSKPSGKQKDFSHNIFKSLFHYQV